MSSPGVGGPAVTSKRYGLFEQRSSPAQIPKQHGSPLWQGIKSLFRRPADALAHQPPSSPAKGRNLFGGSTRHQGYTPSATATGDEAGSQLGEPSTRLYQAGPGRQDNEGQSAEKRHDEIHQLLSDKRQLQADKHELQVDNCRLLAENKQLKSNVQQLRSEVTALQAQLAGNESKTVTVCSTGYRNVCVRVELGDLRRSGARARGGGQQRRLTPDECGLVLAMREKLAQVNFEKDRVVFGLECVHCLLAVFHECCRYGAKLGFAF